MVDPNPNPAIPGSDSPPIQSERKNETILSGLKSVSFAGLAFIYISAFGFAIIFYRLLRTDFEHRSLIDYLPELIMSSIVVFAALLGVGLVRSAGLSTSAPNLVINPQEWSVISDEVKAGNEEAVTQYIRLTSLTGFTGAFTKLGLQGLPLATIGLTIFFSLMYLRDAAYIELTKLTLGAFIGSFVQKQVGAGQSGGTVKLPSGDKVKVSPAVPTVA